VISQSSVSRHVRPLPGTPSLSIRGNESANLNMPALLPAGPEKMIERTKASDLMVPLGGYRVYVVGASPAGLGTL
jgi:hypothetical protein